MEPDSFSCFEIRWALLCSIYLTISNEGNLDYTMIYCLDKLAGHSALPFTARVDGRVVSLRGHYTYEFAMI